jgi:beta-galactosidase
VTALNDTLSSDAVLDGQWSMFDYARGYHPVRAATGVMDIFRLPKFSYHFYRSQRAPDETGAGWTVGPMVFIASHWTAASNLRVLVFSNCEEVELSLNGVAVSRLTPSRVSATQYLPHPPFVFDLPRFEPGTLDAVGLIGGRICARHRVGTPGAFERIELSVDTAGVFTPADGPDLLLAHAYCRDVHGNLCVDQSGHIEFAVEGEAQLMGPAKVCVEAGIASTLLRVSGGAQAFQLNACACNPRGWSAKYLWHRAEGRTGLCQTCAVA